MQDPVRPIRTMFNIEHLTKRQICYRDREVVLKTCAHVGCFKTGTMSLGAQLAREATYIPRHTSCDGEILFCSSCFPAAYALYKKHKVLEHALGINDLVNEPDLLPQKCHSVEELKIAIGQIRYIYCLRVNMLLLIKYYRQGMGHEHWMWRIRRLIGLSNIALQQQTRALLAAADAPSPDPDAKPIKYVLVKA